MRKLIPFLFLFIGPVQAQDYILPQKNTSASNASRITFDMVDATDGYTAETGLTPTCTIKVPHATSYSSCFASPTEIGTGTYQIALNGRETQNLGHGSLYITAAGARPARVKFYIIDEGSMHGQYANLIEVPSNYNNTTFWVKTGVTVTEDSTADYQGSTIGDTITGDGAATTHKVQMSVPKPEGSGLYYFTTEVKTGSLNNAFVGDASYAAGIDFNTSTGVATPSTNGYLRGWKIDKLASSWWRIHILYSTGQSDVTHLAPVIALGNGTGTGVQSFATSGTMIFARTKLMRAEDVSQGLIDTIRPHLSAAASTTSVTLDANETTGNDVLKNREICFNFGYTASIYWKVNTHCQCITAYNGTTKVATLYSAVSTTLNNTYQYKIGGSCLYTVAVSSVGTDAISASSIGADAIGASEIAASAIGASELATDAIGADEIGASAITSSEFAQSAADKTWDTAPQDGSASTALGYLDAIKKYVSNKMTVVGSNYTIYKDDQTTSYATGTTNSAGRDPD